MRLAGQGKEGRTKVVTPLAASGDEALAIAEDTGRYIRALEKVLAEAMAYHSHDIDRLREAIGRAHLEAQEARYLSDQTVDIIRAERRRKRRRQGNE